MPVALDTHATALHALLDSVGDTREIVVRRFDDDDVLRAAWRGARDDAAERWAAWARTGGRDAWASYLAARDREEAAVAALAAD